MVTIEKLLLQHPNWITAVVVLGLAALPVAVWLDLRNLSDQALQEQATSIDSLISKVRSYYAKNVIQRVQNNPGQTQALHNYHAVSGAIPIPATLSIELGEVIRESQENIDYRFVSDHAFSNRVPHQLDEFELAALDTFRKPGNTLTSIRQTTGSLFDRGTRIATPVKLTDSCVKCHNEHPLSPKRDWAAGDVRGIQEVFIHQPIAANLFSFRYLLLYLVCAGTIGFGFAITQYRQARSFRRLNDELTAGNSFLESISMQISKYLSPQVYRSIFSGETEATISTRRKKLTIFFSDIKDFTSTTERLQPEELTSLLNEYFTEMSNIALSHGATLDKYIGDAILIFFGDPESRGIAEDARACMNMALEMQSRLKELNDQWRERGIEHPFKVRMGINTGYCNVGNFGSNERMDYTIIGAEANLASRLESIAEPGGMVISYETYVLVRDLVEATALEPIKFKGIARKVVPYAVINQAPGESRTSDRRIETSLPGVRLYVDIDAIEDSNLDEAKIALQAALASINRRK